MLNRSIFSTEPLHILVVDEHDEASSHARLLLERAGYRVTTVDLPDIGLVRRVEPDAVVLGLIYRGQATGLDFLERHAADPMTRIVPIVVRASKDDLDAGQWARLAALAHPIVSMTHSTERLLGELQRVLARTPA